jgi:SAM-dependent methyltransferase
MELQEYTRMYELEDHHWWFQGRLRMVEGMYRRSIAPQLATSCPRLLDLGCGTGLFLQRRAGDSHALGVDASPEALRYCQRRGTLDVVRVDAAHLPFANASMDVVTAFDLTEHVSDDRALVEEIRRVLKPGGFLLATVPAHPVLWTGHDVSLHHRRRYRRCAFESLFPSGRWHTERMTAAFFLIFPLALLIRLGRRLAQPGHPARSDTGPAPAWLNALLGRLHAVEAAWLARYNLPVGVSFITIRRKIGDHPGHPIGPARGVNA